MADGGLADHGTGTPEGYRLSAEGPGGAPPGMRRHWAWQVTTGTTVGLTVVAQDTAVVEAHRQWVRHEARVARAIGPAARRALVADDPDAPLPWLVTAPATGPSLADAIGGRGALPAAGIRELGVALAHALRPLHDEGVGHGALSSATVELTDEGPVPHTGCGLLHPVGAAPTPDGDVGDLAALLLEAAGGPRALPPELAAFLTGCAEDAGGRPGVGEVADRLADALPGEFAWPGAADAAAPGEGRGALAGPPPADGASDLRAAPDDPDSATSYRLPAPAPLPPTPATVPPVPRGSEGAPPGDDQRTTWSAPVSPAGPPAPDRGAAPEKAPSRRALLGVAAAAGAVGALTGAAGVAGWVVGRGGGSRALFSPYPEPRPLPSGVAPAPVWRYDAPGESPFSPRVQESGTVLVSSTNRMTGLDLATGEELWTRGDLGVDASLLQDVAPMRLGEDRMAFLHRGELVVIDTETGARVWTDTRYLPEDPDYVGHRIDHVHWDAEDGQTLLLWTRTVKDDVGDTHGIALYDAAEREERWHVPVPMDASDALFFVHGESVHTVSVVDGGFRHASYRLRDGQEEQVRALDDVMTFSWLTPLENRGLLISGLEGDIQVHDAVTLDLRWERPIGTAESRLGNPRVEILRFDGEEREVLLVNDRDTQVIALDLGSGEELWRAALRDESAYAGIIHPRMALSPSGSTLLVGGLEVMALDARTGTVQWAFRHAERADLATYSVFAGPDAMLVWDGTTAFGLPVE
ncbi:PQQ-binding-like beta-propeller repeat protein [Streptomyces profundus]|uniref:outer membrane protein assembly factor BamB family protein n=1 Tax=Streptomyces profundus TaxID=2867410 RepID=UPI001D160072|nr:PQQ-binding-like beta-propeller repeat protein [Streptomyces sp. MA3_2.13]UED87485.1 PQQ-binding-like beta-propeller repeat protein [Streptomyces sp. MA3_2.13]